MDWIFFIGSIVGGHFWFKWRKTQKKPQPFVIHLIDVLVMLAVGIGWFLVAVLVLALLFPR